ncbi:uncharacterized protein LOC127806349 isoform X2 [Diospyros lotus]|uniref:uncharacterized protein LOC127806349 isoform X2 n=1 Tax=Diospyros lotus TaxID=55363 RepID=UPI0022560554|nr:uncharacterized protein LOC127806349 isoform X2 [Diospyros lotus]
MHIQGMSLYVSSSSLHPPNSTAARLVFRSCNVSLPLFSCSRPILITTSSKNPSRSRISASVADSSPIHVSWFSPDPTGPDDYGGWAVAEAPIHRGKKGGLRSVLLVGIGTSIAALLAAFSYFSLSGRGLSIQFSSPLPAIYGVLRPSVMNEAVESGTTGYDAFPGNAVVPEANLEWVSNSAVETVAMETHHKGQEGKLGRIMIPVAVDSTQQEALLILKKLKIIDDDVKADELCTKREYARWLVRVNSLLERNPKRRIIPSVALSGSIFTAFDDVKVEDPDFVSIQSLAESGIVRSKLAGKKSSSDLDDSKGQGGVYFFPERFIPRQDLIDWRVQLEYEAMQGMNEKISATDLDFMDTREITSDASPELFVDMLAGDESILRKVFGRGKRFQPNKPSTNAQAAVALTSGRMAEAIRAELISLDAENSSRQKAMEEIRSELLSRVDIQRHWDRKKEEEKTRGFEVQRAFLAAIHDLEQEKGLQENSLADRLKKKATVDCQKQLLFSLKEEVSEMSKRLACEKDKYEIEHRNLQDTLSNLQVKLDETSDTKSILEAEIEALGILRSWIEEEARKSQARAKVLEEVGRRWKWGDNQA